MKQKYILFMLFAILSLKGISQNNYAVAPIPFQPFSGTLAPLTTEDDRYSGVINLPFNFDFYGTSYNQIIVSTNGYIDFRTDLAGQYSPWAISYQIPWPSFAVKSSIFGCYSDLNNPVGGQGAISYGTYGTAPNRKFVVVYDNQPHYQCNNTIAPDSFQISISEASSIIDVQIINRTPCNTWQQGAGVIGLINSDGTQGITPPGRNTGSWTASQEAWRFYRPNYYPNYSFVRCGDMTTGIQFFNLAVAAGDLSSSPSGVTFHETMVDAQTNVNAIANTASYANITNPQTIYANSNGIVKPVILSVVDCNIDFDSDNAASEIEDVNGDSNLANDDTDFDGIPNYLDNDDDGDLVLTNLEYVFANKNNVTQGANILRDTDSDGIPNYLDNDDDGDNVLTFLEDYNRDGNPSNDDTNTNGSADYLDFAVALGVTPITLTNDAIKLYPNPTTEVLNIQNNAEDTNALIEIYAINGAKVKSLKATETLTTISVADLQTGVYFVKVTLNNQVGNYKFIKN